MSVQTQNGLRAMGSNGVLITRLRSQRTDLLTDIVSSLSGFYESIPERRLKVWFPDDYIQKNPRAHGRIYEGSEEQLRLALQFMGHRQDQGHPQAIAHLWFNPSPTGSIDLSAERDKYLSYLQSDGRSILYH